MAKKTVLLMGTCLKAKSARGHNARFKFAYYNRSCISRQPRLSGHEIHPQGTFCIKKDKGVSRHRTPASCRTRLSALASVMSLELTKKLKGQPSKAGRRSTKSTTTSPSLPRSSTRVANPERWTRAATQNIHQTGPHTHQRPTKVMHAGTPTARTRHQTGQNLCIMTVLRYQEVTGPPSRG